MLVNQLEGACMAFLDAAFATRADVFFVERMGILTVGKRLCTYSMSYDVYHFDSHFDGDTICCNVIDNLIDVSRSFWGNPNCRIGEEQGPRFLSRVWVDLRTISER